jgi:hypothetical protein
MNWLTRLVRRRPELSVKGVKTTFTQAAAL